MVVASASLTSLTAQWIGFGVAAALILVVAALLVLIVRSARQIASVAADATRTLAETRDRTEILWAVRDTNQIAGEILGAAAEARRALGG